MNLSIEYEGGHAMTSWTRNDLGRIGAADELQLASFKEDGTLRKSVTVWKDVTFVDVSDDEALNNKIDAAYQSKYQRYSATYVDPMIVPQARATTLKLVPSE